MRLIQLTQGKFAKVDDADYELVSQHNWHYNSHGYAYRYAGGGRKNRKRQAMHQLLGGYKLVDHENGDGLDNRRSNLRPANKSLNAANSKIRSDNTSGYKGVYKSAWGYYAQVQKDEKVHHLGTFKTIKEAARAYNQKAKELFGEYARLNNV